METQTAVPNPDMRAAWDGEEGDRWTRSVDHYDRAVAAYDAHLDAAAGVAAGDRVLDVGCGCGISTRGAARRTPDGLAVGIDLSRRMLELAGERARAEGLANVRFEQADAQVHAFDPGAFDVVISRFGAMFFEDPVRAFANLGAALRPGGRLAMLTWQPLSANEWVGALRDALAAGRALPEPAPGAPGPFGLAEGDAVRSILEQAGFDEPEVRGLNEPVWLGADPDDARVFVSDMGLVRGLLQGLDDEARAVALRRLGESIAAHARPEGVLFASSAWLVTARRS